MNRNTQVCVWEVILSLLVFVDIFIRYLSNNYTSKNLYTRGIIRRIATFLLPFFQQRIVGQMRLVDPENCGEVVIANPLQGDKSNSPQMVNGLYGAILLSVCTVLHGSVS